MMTPQKSYQKKCEAVLNQRIKDVDEVIHNFDIELIVELLNKTPKDVYVDGYLLEVVIDFVKAISFKLKLFEVKYFYGPCLESLNKYLAVFNEARCFDGPNFWNKYICYNKAQKLVRTTMFLQCAMTEISCIEFEDEPRIITEKKKGSNMFS